MPVWNFLVFRRRLRLVVPAMKITKVRTHLLTAKWVDDLWFPPMLHSTAVIRVETDANLDGLGEE